LLLGEERRGKKAITLLRLVFQLRMRSGVMEKLRLGIVVKGDWRTLCEG
jgi:hypothetical protein